MKKILTLPVMLVLLTSCNKPNDESQAHTASNSKTVTATTPTPVVEMAHETNSNSADSPPPLLKRKPVEKFAAANTTINSFESTNTFNSYGFAYRYEKRSDDNQSHYYKMIQEFEDNHISGRRTILNEAWVEITPQEWLSTQHYYEKTHQIQDLNPKILQSTNLFANMQQFLQQQQARNQRFKAEQAEFMRDFNQRRVDFDKNFNAQLARFNQDFDDVPRSRTDTSQQDNNTELSSAVSDDTTNSTNHTQVNDSLMQQAQETTAE